MEQLNRRGVIVVICCLVFFNDEELSTNPWSDLDEEMSS